MQRPSAQSRHHSSHAGARRYLLLLLLLAACAGPPPDPGPQPLADFSERVSALVTTTTRGHLRDQPGRQATLRTLLPALREAADVADLTGRLRGAPELEEIAGTIESDIGFELEKPEHSPIRERYRSPEVQRQVVQAVVRGMERALTQLQGG